MKSRERRFQAKDQPEVWCSQCMTTIRRAPDSIIDHFRKEHERSPTTDELEGILAKTPVSMGQRNKFQVPLNSPDNPKDPELVHDQRWRHVIQGGAPGLGKRR